MNDIGLLLATIQDQSFEKSNWVGKISLNSIPRKEKENLFQTVENIKDAPVIVSILSYFFDEFNTLHDKLRTLELGIRSNQFSVEKKKIFLDSYFSLLSKEKINTPEKDFKGFLADYKVLSAFFAVQLGNFDDAIRLGNEAIQLCTEIKDNGRSQKIGELIREWETQKAGDQYIIPLEKLSTERMNLQQEIDEYKREVEALRSSFQNEKKKIEHEMKLILKQKHSLENDFSKLKDEVEQLYSESLSLQQKINSQHQLFEQNRPFIEFLRILPKVVEVPLWIEIARLALIQGEIDELAWQALNRLATIDKEFSFQELKEFILRGAASNFELDSSLLEKYLHFFEEFSKISDILPQDPIRASTVICASWETMFLEKHGIG